MTEISLPYNQWVSILAAIIYAGSVESSTSLNVDATPASAVATARKIIQEVRKQPAP